MPHFHAKNGEGYQFISDSIIDLDKLNPQVAARLAGTKKIQDFHVLYVTLY